MKKIWMTLVVCALAPCGVFAHGDKDKNLSAAVRKEQKPWGIAGDAKSVRRTIEIIMSDNMRFTPDVIQLKQGEVLRLVVKNAGKMQHEIVLGTKAELEKHAALMLKFPNMEHDEPYMAHVKPGASSELIWHFNRPGEFDFACLLPGHYQAGMVGKIKVARVDRK